MLDFTQFKVLTFDCYGTLIDWEAGILNAFRPLLAAHNVTISDAEILEHYATLESSIQKLGYLPYKEVLKRVVLDFGKDYNFKPTKPETQALADSLQYWPPFPDTINALQTLKKFFKLAIISNIDNDLFQGSQELLKTEFDWVITAEQVKNYKPSLDNFNVAISEIGLPSSAILHVAQSLYHDIVPANQMGITNVWVNRRNNKDGFGATLPATAKPTLEVPDLQTLALMVEQELIVTG
jgi:2-haloacid dehalogenase